MKQTETIVTRQRSTLRVGQLWSVPDIDNTQQYFLLLAITHIDAYLGDKLLFSVYNLGKVTQMNVYSVNFNCDSYTLISSAE